MKLPNIPYFYIIRETDTGRLYAGSKSSRNAHPDLFWNTNHKHGYFTSSKEVKRIISVKGSTAFTVSELKTSFDIDELRDYIKSNPELERHVLSFVYETKYLRDNECANSFNYINKHNNDGAVPDFSHPKQKAEFLEVYGVENPSQSPVFQAKKKTTSLSNYGVEWSMQSEEVRNRAESTKLQKYGFKNLFESSEIQEKIKQECLEKYGVRDHSSRPEISEKISNSHTGKLKSEEHKKNLSIAKKGKVRALDIRDNTVKVVSKLEFDTNEFLIGDTAGRIPVRDSKGKGLLVHADDPRYISGELVHVSKGYTMYLDSHNNPVWLHFSEAEKLGLKKRKTTRGNIIHNPKTMESKVLLKETIEYEKLISEGWVLGSAPNVNYKKRHIKKEGVSLQIPVNDLDAYLNKGWMVGRIIKRRTKAEIQLAKKPK